MFLCTNLVVDEARSEYAHFMLQQRNTSSMNLEGKRRRFTSTCCRDREQDVREREPPGVFAFAEAEAALEPIMDTRVWVSSSEKDSPAHGALLRLLGGLISLCSPW